MAEAMAMQTKDLMAVRAEAGEWLLRMSDGELSREERRRFELWRAADPRHAAIFEEMSETWEDMTQLRHLRPMADPNPLPPMWRRALDASLAAMPRPRLALGGLLAAAAIVAVLLFAPPLFDQPNAHYATQIAEVYAVRLSDGSVVTLGADSEIDERFSEGERRVTLRNGEAFFEVAHNSERPFFVEAGAATIRVVGTKFDVRRRESGVGVAVLEGEVHVADDRQVSDARARVLRAGQSVEVLERPALLGRRAVVQRVASVRAAPPGDWRKGRLTYDGARLADVAADINRYYAPGFAVSEDAADLLVTASFKANEIEGFLTTLDIALPVEVARSSDGAFATRRQRLN